LLASSAHLEEKQGCIRLRFEYEEEKLNLRREAGLTAPHRYYRHGVGTTDEGWVLVKELESEVLANKNLRNHEHGFYGGKDIYSLKHFL
jgi:hypothetical protein